MPRKAPDAQMRRAREPHPCSRAPPSVLAKVTSTQSRRAGAPLVSAYAPRPATASTATASSVPATAFSRRPQRSGSDSRRCCSNMIMPEGYWREPGAVRPLRGAGGLLGSALLLLGRGGGGRIKRQRERVDAVPLAGGAGTVVEHVAEVAPAPAAAHLRAPHHQAVVRAQFHRLRDGRLGEARPTRSRVELGAGAEQHRPAGRAP